MPCQIIKLVPLLQVLTPSFHFSYLFFWHVSSPYIHSFYLLTLSFIFHLTIYMPYILARMSPLVIHSRPNFSSYHPNIYHICPHCLDLTTWYLHDSSPQSKYVCTCWNIVHSGPLLSRRLHYSDRALINMVSAYPIVIQHW